MADLTRARSKGVVGSLVRRTAMSVPGVRGEEGSMS